MGDKNISLERSSNPYIGVAERVQQSQEARRVSLLSIFSDTTMFCLFSDPLPQSTRKEDSLTMANGLRADITMNDSRASNKKRRRTDNGRGTADEPQLSLLWLYQSDLGDRILSYASGADLCTLDILNKQFNRLTNDQWDIVTKDRFGMNNGKEGWKVGTAFLRPPVFMHNISNYEEEGDAGRALTIGLWV